MTICFAFEFPSEIKPYSFNLQENVLDESTNWSHLTFKGIIKNKKIKNEYSKKMTTNNDSFQNLFLSTKLIINKQNDLYNGFIQKNFSKFEL